MCGISRYRGFTGQLSSSKAKFIRMTTPEGSEGGRDWIRNSMFRIIDKREYFGDVDQPIMIGPLIERFRHADR